MRVCGYYRGQAGKQSHNDVRFPSFPGRSRFGSRPVPSRFRSCFARKSGSSAKNRFGTRAFNAANLGRCPHLYRDIAIIGLPLGTVMVLYNLEQAAVTAIAVSFGTAVSDGFGIGARLCGFLLMAVFGIAVGASVTVGLHLGPERADVVRRALPSFTGGGTAAFGVIALPLALLGKELVRHLTQDAATVAAGGTYPRFMATALCLLCVQRVFNAAFGGAGRNMPSLLASAAMYLGVELPAVLALAFLGLLTPEVLWAAMTVTAAAGALLSALLFRYGGWLVKPLSEELQQKGKTRWASPSGELSMPSRRPHRTSMLAKSAMRRLMPTKWRRQKSTHGLSGSVSPAFAAAFGNQDSVVVVDGHSLR